MRYWHGAPHVSGPISRRTDMGIPMSMDRKFDIFKPLTWGSSCQWTNFQTHWHGAPHVNGPKVQYFETTDMGLPMSIDQLPDALTWGSPCQWTENSIFSNQWHGAPHVNGPKSQYFQTSDMGLPMSIDHTPLCHTYLLTYHTYLMGFSIMPYIPYNTYLWQWLCHTYHTILTYGK